MCPRDTYNNIIVTTFAYCTVVSLVPPVPVSVHVSPVLFRVYLDATPLESSCVTMRVSLLIKDTAAGPDNNNTPWDIRDSRMNVRWLRGD